jgi:YHS domain-containing protein
MDTNHDSGQPHEGTTGLATDPVCGMSVDPGRAPGADLVVDHGGKTYFFCGRCCKLEFQDDPARYVDASYHPSM